MWLLFRVILPALVVFLLTPVASANTDAPDIVRIDVDLTWNVPSLPSFFPGPVRLSGSELWQNGVGYYVEKPSSTRWHVEGACNGCGFIDQGQLIAIPLAKTFVIALESSVLPSQSFNGQRGEYEFGVSFGPNDLTLQPGDYPISAFFAPDGPSLSPDGGYQRIVNVPEPKVLRRLWPRHIYGKELAALANPRLQPLTAWGAAKILQALGIGAISEGAFITLPSVKLEVQEWCSGLVSMKWLLLLAGTLLFVGSAPWPWKLGVLIAAPLIALEVNMLRVAGVGVGIEFFGHASRGAIKDWTASAATVFGVVQVVGLGWLINRQRPPTA
jgi:exosortase/archaeosortase family protein